MTMRDGTQKRVQLFIDNYHVIKNRFVWKTILLKRLAAIIYTLKGQTLSYETISETMRMIKGSVSVFSYFRGDMILAVATMISLQNDRQRAIEKALTVYKMMKAERFRRSSYLVIAACQIAIETDEEDFSAVVGRARDYYRGMRSQHFFVTSERDYISAALLAVSGIDPQSGLLDLEMMHKSLKTKIYSGRGVQGIAQALLMGRAGEGGAERALALREAFRQRNLRLDRDYNYQLIGLLALLGIDTDMLADEVVDTFRYMRKQKGFGTWSINKYELILIAASLVVTDIATRDDGGAAVASVSTGVTAMIVNQYIAILIMMATASAAAVTAATVAPSVGN